jgi:hypothetical protein
MILADTSLLALPGIPVLSDSEVLHFIDQENLYGQGIGWVDTHLLGSVMLSGARLWTLDRALLRVARRLGSS